MRVSIFLFSFLLFVFPLFSNEQKIRTLYNSLDPHSPSQLLAFYELFPTSTEGKKALNKAWELFGGRGGALQNMSQLSPSSIHSIVNLVNLQPNSSTPMLNDQQLQVVEALASEMPNRRLKGYWAKSEAEIIALPVEEIDLGHGLLLSQMQDEENAAEKMRSYEGMLDLMALQIKARLPARATPEQKIRTINNYIFYEMRFRFPPKSIHAKEIDLYTFLPSVMDSRQGVCLGVSILYLCLAQRLDLPLEVITPPGHIYIRYNNGKNLINIETTARGVDVDSEVYLGIETKGLELRNIKEVIGMAHMNQAAVYSRQDKIDQALASYLKARPYLPENMLLKELMGYHYLFAGQIDEGKRLLNEVQRYIPDFSIEAGTIPEDYLRGQVDAEAVKTVFMEVDETRESILKKKHQIEKDLERCPLFREGWLNLATAWLQLHRVKEALEALEKYWTLYPHDARAAYYLSVIHAERLDYNQAWKCLQIAENVVHQADHHPIALVHYRRQLAKLCPE